MNLRLTLLAAFLLQAVAFAADTPSVPKEAADVITPADLLKHIKVLASDEFEGRAPGSKGEELSIKYISDQFHALGLEPGNPDGTYFQNVPLVGITADPSMKLTLSGHGKTLSPKYQDDFVAQTRRVVESSPLD